MNLPAAYARRLGLFGVLPFVILTALSAPLLGRIEVDPALGAVLPDDDPLVLAVEEAERHLYSTDYIQIIVSAEELFAPRTFDTVHQLSTRVASAPGAPLVISATTVQDLRSSDGTISTTPVVPADPDAEQAETAEATIAETPLYRNLLLTPDGAAHVVYAFADTAEDLDTLGEHVQAVAADLRAQSSGVEIAAFGWPVSKALIEDAILRDLRVLGIASLALVFLIEIVAVRRVGVAVVLWLVSAASALWALASFPLLGQDLSSYTLMVPVTVLALATSYGIHVYRYYSTHPALSMGESIRGVTPIVLTAASTTVVGFSSLLLTPNARLQSLGMLIAVGVSLALVASLFCLPAVFEHLDRNRGTRRLRSENVLAGSVHRPGLRAAVLVIVIAAAAVGASVVEPHPSPRDAFVSSSIPGRYFDRYYRYTGANEQVEVYLDTGTEFGLVDMATYEAVSAAAAEIEALPHVVEVLAFPDFVAWINGRLAGLDAPLSPDNEMVLGESLELLFSQDTGLGIDALVDPAYRRCKFLLLFDNRPADGERPAARREALFSAVNEIMTRRLPEAEHLVAGGFALTRRSEAYLRDSQLRSALSFFAFLFGLLLFLFRDLRWTLVAMLPTALGILFYYGIHGWLGMTTSFLSVFFVAGLMGVSNDDVLYLTLSVRAAGGHSVSAVSDALSRSGGAIVQTTLIIAIGIGTFGFSSYRLLGQGGLVFAASLALCTAVTLFVVPSLIARIGVKGRRG